MSTTVLLIGGCAVASAVIKAVGPMALGGRALPARFVVVIALTAPALLAGLVATAALGDGDSWSAGADTAGVAAGAAAGAAATALTVRTTADGDRRPTDRSQKPREPRRWAEVALRRTES